MASATEGATSSVAHLLGEIAPSMHKHPMTAAGVPLIREGKLHRIMEEATDSGGSSRSRPHVTPSSSTVASDAAVLATATVPPKLPVALILEE